MVPFGAALSVNRGSIPHSGRFDDGFDSPVEALHVPLEAQDVLDLLAVSVVSHPSAIAVSSRGVEVSYQVLDGRSNQIARALVDSGSQPGTIVAVFVEDPLERIVAILGCLKAGCVFAPMDPQAPQERLRKMLDTVRARWTIVDRAAAVDVSLIGGDEPIAVVAAGTERLGDDAFGPGATLIQSMDFGRQALRVSRSPDEPCYLYFTSGSTGTPKAILGRTRGLAHFIQWEIGAFGLGPGLRVSQLTAPAFDVYLRDVFVPLCSGGTVCVPPANVARDPLGLARWLEAERIGLVHCVPSVFRLLLQQDLAPDRFPDLRFVLLAGEPLPVADANRWISRFGTRARLVNLYGPTETTLAKFFHPLPAEPLEQDFVPIGRPIPGAQALLLDERLTACAPGELGELYIRTPYRSLGYLGGEAALDPAFIVNPFTGAEDDIVYRTGDLARMLPDGNFRFCGRKDFQVKIRGVRVEPGEVEARMLEHPGIREAVVVGSSDASGEMRLVAYYVPVDAPVAASGLRKFLSQSLPEAMLPAVLIPLERFPLSPNGKLDRKALPPPGKARPELAVSYEPAAGAVESQLCGAFADALDLELIGRNDNFFELGGNSLLAARLLAKLQELAERPLPPTILFGHPTPAALAAAMTNTAGAGLNTRRLATVHRDPGRRTSSDVAAGREAIAIIGMAGRFPGASNVEEFWENLCAGRESITRFRDDQLDPSITAVERQDPGYVRARGVLEDVEYFDAGFFGVNPREAELMDPQHRIFLELCWECMERAGEVPDAALVPVGVFAGTYHSTYLRRHVAAHPDRVALVGQYQVTLANEKDYLATRVANKLNLTGPAISLYTACSTSLVAVCQALDSLRAGRCDMALAGGISITCPPRSGYIHQAGAMFSPDGHTRAFDAQAQGTVFSDGAGVVLLKRLSDAIRDGNPIHAVMIGAAVNNDGAEKASFTAPNGHAQAAVIAMAQDDARVSPRSIGYVETHGTATPMGDPIEMEGLLNAFRRGTADSGFCRIGSVKSNIGHVVIAAGAAGIIKTSMALSHGKIPASLHFDQANPAIDFSASPFRVNGELSDWQQDSEPLRAGVSSFGVGGTNAHVVLEQAPPLQESEPAAGPHLLVLSARSSTGLAASASRLADALQADFDRSGNAPAMSLPDVAWTLATGRKAFAHRISLVCSDQLDAIDQLRGPEAAATMQRSRPARTCEPVFLFPGQGSHYAGMGRELCKTEPAFRMAIDECHEALYSANGFDLQGLFSSEDPAALLPTAVMQPAIFSVEYALARLWMARGVMPSAMIGHSVGEFVAATLAGIFTLADALTLVERRGALMQAQPGGAMLSVALTWDELSARLPSGLSLAAENAPGCCVVSGPAENVSEWQRQLNAEGIACRELHTSHAFHSAMMEPVIAPFRTLVAAASRSAPSIPIVSGSSGDWLDSVTATSPDYWASHLRNPVRFATALARVLSTPEQVLLEVGPRSTLCSLARQHPLAQSTRAVAIASLADSVGSENSCLRRAAGQLWCAGVAVDLSGFDQRSRRRRVLLPTYPFERQRFWVDAAPEVAAPQPVAASNIESERIGMAIELEKFANPTPSTPVISRPDEVGPSVTDRLLEMLRGATGLELSQEDRGRSFVELGLDSLMLTQVALQLQRKFNAKVTFRQLMGEYSSLARLTTLLETSAPIAPAPPASSPPAETRSKPATAPARPVSRLVKPAIPGARLGRDRDGTPAWFAPHPDLPGKFLRIES